MDAAPAGLTRLPAPQFVMTAEGDRLATYTWGDETAPTVLCVHGFGSSTRDNWVATGWVRDLLAAGLRVLAVDQRGHGASDKPHAPGSYEMTGLVTDLVTVLDTYLLDSVRYVGYSLGGRVGWQAAVDVPHRIERAVLGGIPDGRPLARMQIAQVKAYLDDGRPVEDEVTRRYISLAERVSSNDLQALVALAEGMRLGDSDPDPASPPTQPVLFATGSEDPILEESRRLASSAPQGTFVEIPGRTHVNAPGSRDFRQAGVAFLRA
ncbi:MULTISPECIES: alpha/beta fold hydrolase [unclassified Microbacterium]|uniref:alpha/beta fold hydrolase n=1 Tax=unclassified Microbacterium TaxID=2609290 RepID=UPI00214C4FC6|nr:MULTISPECIES: alpha/beta hydrolase [unclassified Microbacterium]MCR2800596.1 alpha/beta hydrolase [Microbacterium sp. zg.Y818]MCR2825910.1 alpha/beta hydrolase [Microbacterium sp. zg.Y909]WIM23323.1 alpha/beta hydrolase [Microbacterium sp. zg-Y818]